ncbi:MAG: response regulator [Acidobacteriota bacterium]|nr:response regulator [Acidobacteriota bacterium]
MNKKIVVIDDDKVTLKLLENTLSKLGLQVFLAQDGEKGLELAKEIKPDIVLSDMLIPKLHGLDLCQRIKSDPELKQIKVILMTAVYKSLPFQQEIKSSGADDFITKPLDINDLTNRIQKMLSTVSSQNQKNE